MSFSVYQFFDDTNESYEKVRDSVDAKSAVETAHSLIHSVGGKIGTTFRVIITDDGDSIVFEWIHGKGITWPDELIGMKQEPKFFQCPNCGRKSYNPHDIEEKYCGGCHQFVDEPKAIEGD